MNSQGCSFIINLTRLIKILFSSTIQIEKMRLLFFTFFIYFLLNAKVYFTRLSMKYVSQILSQILIKFSYENSAEKAFCTITDYLFYNFSFMLLDYIGGVFCYFLIVSVRFCSHGIFFTLFIRFFYELDGD